MKYAIFDQNGLPIAFYDDDIYDNIPENAIQITDEQWLEFINSQGRRKWDFNTNTVVPFDPDELLTLNDLKQRLKDQVHQIRKEKEQQGIIVIGSGSGNRYSLDTGFTGRINLQGILLAFQTNLLPFDSEVPWKFMDGSFHSFTQKQFREIVGFVLDYVKRLFQAENAHFKAIDALTTKNDAKAYDVNVNWPGNEYQAWTLS